MNAISRPKTPATSCLIILYIFYKICENKFQQSPRHFDSKICSFIDTNPIHNFLCKLHKIKFLYMFRASSAHPQAVNDVNCTCMQPLVFSFSAGSRLVHLLRGDSDSPLQVHKTATCREWEYQRLHTCTINIIDLLKMSGWRSKHVEELNFM